MLAADEITGHLLAFLVLCATAALPGYWLSVMLPARLRTRHFWLAALTLGAAYWAAALYVFPFRGGLWVAVGLALGVFAATVLTRLRSRVGRGATPLVLVRAAGTSRTSSRRRRRASLILAAGALPFGTPLIVKHVPDGMDASRYMYNSRLIADRGGLPASLAPFAPNIPFGAANHGIPALAALAVVCGVSPASAFLAVIPFTFVVLILAVYGLVRMVLRRVPAATIAVACVWLAKATLAAPSWGGLPGVFTLAAGLFLARLLVDTLRTGRVSTMFPLGLGVAALPLMHVCMASGWLYLVAPFAALVGIAVSRRRAAGLRAVVAAACLSMIVLLAFLMVGRPSLDSTAAEWIRSNELRSAYPGVGWELTASVPIFAAGGLSRFLVPLVGISLCVLLASGGRRNALLLCTAILANLLLIANARFELLPGSLLLYPSRIQQMLLPVAALAVALGWRSVTTRRRAHRPAVTALVVVLSLVAWSHCARHFLFSATRPTVSEEAWQALQWGKHNLSPADDFVGTLYATAGAYLPGVAGVAVSDWHAHIVGQLQLSLEMQRTRPVTHVLYIERDAIVGGTGRRMYDQHAQRLRDWIEQRRSEVVFQDGPVRIYRLGPGG